MVSEATLLWKRPFINLALGSLHPGAAPGQVFLCFLSKGGLTRMLAGHKAQVLTPLFPPFSFFLFLFFLFLLPWALAADRSHPGTCLSPSGRTRTWTRTLCPTGNKALKFYDALSKQLVTQGHVPHPLPASAPVIR